MLRHWGLVAWVGTNRSFVLLRRNSLLNPELFDFLRNRLLNTSVELRPIPQLEQDLEPDKEGREEHGLEKVVQQGRCAALEGAMADELQDPGYHMHDDGDFGRALRIRRHEGVAEGGTADTEDGEGGASDGFQEDVKAAPEEGSEDTDVRLKVGDLEPFRGCEEGSRVGGLQ